MTARMTTERHPFTEDHHRPDTVAPFWLCERCGKRRSAKVHEPGRDLRAGLMTRLPAPALSAEEARR